MTINSCEARQHHLNAVWQVKIISLGFFYHTFRWKPWMSRLLLSLFVGIVTFFDLPAWAVQDQDVRYIRSVMAKVMAAKPVKITKASTQMAKPPSEPAAPRQLAIVEYLSSQDATVVIDGGSAQGIVEGAIFNSFRQRPAFRTASVSRGAEPDSYIKTGQLKALHVDKTFTLAQVIHEGDEVTKAFFPKQPFPMAGDQVSETQFKIVKNPILTPTTVMHYQDLFEDPKANPASFELTEEGKERIRLAAMAFHNLRVPVLMVEAYTDPEGPESANQVESYQRALTIRQYLVDQLGFNPARVVAIGYGETQLFDSSNVSGFRVNNRRIVFKVNMQVSSR